MIVKLLLEDEKLTGKELSKKADAEVKELFVEVKALNDIKRDRVRKKKQEALERRKKAAKESDDAQGQDDSNDKKVKKLTGRKIAKKLKKPVI